ncbi:MAG: 2-C-methyl-D-erythritol 4-phosphate cytidylyltransferase [Bacteroidales bacterium]|nr:2-C-methyl-D-erythritol 4-phosphate cytidylyltransferase [Bacteroidales bacterium]ODT55307.1 MAG: 2-C-methyl-D-erythritol 4-phosphate cytidylyltransferase [Paludibacter sp. SCN 50-10]OJX91386.1 MAG: 2-C-methyl-D-erythritol 4-phosphate cytidylyltransferase [Paludibacter sp. 47-17]
MNSKSRTVIVVAGGKGERMQTNVPKQFLMLHRQPVLMHTLRRFYDFDRSMKIIVVLPEAEVEYWNRLCYDLEFGIDHRVIHGGPSRFFSVLHGLSAAPDTGLIGVHDGVRPLVSAETIGACYRKAAETGAAVPVTDAVESIRQLTAEGSRAVDRSRYKLVQTPQVFDAQLLKNAYSQEFSPLFTDDASVVEAYGHAVDLVPGNVENIKITTPVDLRIAELLLK